MIDGAALIRIARQADVDAMIGIYEANLNSAYAVGWSPSTLRLKLLTSLHDRKSNYIIVAELEDEIIAWASIAPLMEAHPIIGLGEIRVHVDPAFRLDGFDDALFWDVECAAEERLYLSLRCYAPARGKGERCTCERFKYWERYADEGRSLFGYDSGHTIVYEKSVAGVRIASVT